MNTANSSRGGGDYMTSGEAARWLGFSRQTIMRWCRQGNIECHQVGSQWRIPRAAVEKLLPPVERSA